MDYLARESADLSVELWNRIDDTVIGTARKQLSCRRFLKVFGPLGPGATTVAVDGVGKEEVLEDGIGRIVGRTQLELPLFYEDFTLLGRDLELAAQTGLPVDLSAAIAAAKKAARREDDLVLNGNKALGVDGLLTDQKAEFGNEVIRQAQAILDGMEMGVSIVSLEFKSIKPPSALQYHFDQVNAASVEKETRIQQANQYRERVIPEANAAADKLVSDAQVSQHDRINRANDQVAEFYGLFQEYQQNRDVVYERVFREKVVTIFNQMGGKIVLPEGTNTPQIFLP